MHDARLTARSNKRETASHIGDIAGRIGSLSRPSAFVAAPASQPLEPAIKTAILRTLTQEQRLLVVLRYVERMDTDEIAAVLSTTTDRVEQMHAEVVDLLRKEASRVELEAA